jgi:GT2 family glycosyltransferase
MSKIACTLLILTYKGKHHLEFLLPTIKSAINNTPNYNIDTLIVDNGCDELTRQYVNQHYPEFTYAFSPLNDYLFSLNRFISEIKNEFVFILNDDMRFHIDVLNKVLEVIKKDRSLFSVSCKIRDWNDTYTASGVRMLKFQRGWAKSWYEDANENQIQYTLYGGGGAAVFRTEIYNKLKGFDPLYRPAYCEDLDLGHRAWHLGYQIVYYPQAVLYHREGGTIKEQFKADKLEQNIYKNQVLWMVRNANKRHFLWAFLLLLPYRLLMGWRIGKNPYIALWLALVKVPLAVLKRLLDPKWVVRDEEIIELLGKPYTQSNINNK